MADQRMASSRLRHFRISQPSHSKISPIFIMKRLAQVLAWMVMCSAASAAPSGPLSSEPQRVLYQIYVESFQDGAGLSDAAGDFAGIEQRIPYLKDLGVTGILMMPIFDADG